jgi:hypothetical protein
MELQFAVPVMIGRISAELGECGLRNTALIIYYNRYGYHPKGLSGFVRLEAMIKTKIKI